MLIAVTMLLAQVTAPPVAIRRSEQETLLQPAQRLIIDNPHGDVRLLPVEGSTARFLLVAQYPIESSEVPSHALTNTSAHILVRVQAAESLRADLTVLLPKTTAVRAETGAGRIIAAGLAAPIEAITRDDLIAIKSQSAIHATTRNGHLDLVLTAGDGRVYARSRHGPIDIELPAGDYAFSMSTAGDVTTDSVRVLSALATDGDTRSGRTGDPAIDVQVTSDTGNIRILADPDRHPVRLRPKR